MAETSWWNENDVEKRKNWHFWERTRKRWEFNYVYLDQIGVKTISLYFRLFANGRGSGGNGTKRTCHMHTSLSTKKIQIPSTVFTIWLGYFRFLLSTNRNLRPKNLKRNWNVIGTSRPLRSPFLFFDCVCDKCGQFRMALLKCVVIDMEYLSLRCYVRDMGNNSVLPPAGGFE